MGGKAQSSHLVRIAADQAGERLDRALASALAGADPPPSRSRIKGLIAAGRVAIGGRTISEPAHRVKPGDAITIIIPEAAPAAPAAQPLPLDIVFEDEHLIVVDKAAGVVVHPAPGNPDRTLVNALLAHCGDSLAGIGGVRRPGIVHRLDKDTSGLMVVAKTDAAYAALARQFAARRVERVYAALVWGVPTPRTGEISGAIGRHRTDRKKMAVVARAGKPALTRYRVVKVFAGGAASLIECRLATGRTHQIRVHLAHIGHPLVGDPTYGRASSRRSGLVEGLTAEASKALAGFRRQALDAVILGFDHPTTGARALYHKKYSSDLNALISYLDGL